MSLTREVEEYALDLGFDRVGFTSAAPFDQLTGALAERRSGYSWVSEGLLQLARVADPAFVLPGARALIVLLYDYHKQSFPPALLGKVGKAYQARLYTGKKRVFGARLRLLKEFLEQQGIEIGVRPALPERQAAVRAGLGKFGRNTFLYAPGIGSYAAITTLAVNKELDGSAFDPGSSCPDDCRLCIDACPTGAIYAPFKMDPLHCISFHTYGTGNFPGAPADIPYEIREKMGSWIYGCDICQDACPRNRRTLKRVLSPDAYLHEVAAPTITLTNLLNMDDAFFQTKVQTLLYGYIWEKKFLQRNAAIALGNSGDETALPDLEQAAADPEEMVRAYTAWALGRIGGKHGKKILETHRAKEQSEAVSAEINRALEQI